MAESLAHKFGQLIGNFLEIAIEPYLRELAKKQNLYLDIKGERETRTGKKLTWVDIKNNKHDLDFVLERGGTESKLGVPVAFIETAWRRYKKHSKNKVQEIQSAILPLVAKYSDASPFMGVLLAGNFTKPSLAQLTSQGFVILHFQYQSVIAAFMKYGIDVSSEEQTDEEEFRAKIKAMENSPHKQEIAEELLSTNKDGLRRFLEALEYSITRKVESVMIWPLYGAAIAVSNLDEAIGFLKKYEEKSDALPFVKYEIIIKYNTGTVINATCINKSEAIDFLERNAPGSN